MVDFLTESSSPISISGQQPSHSHRRGSTFGRSVSHRNRSSECAAAAVRMRRLLSIDGHGAARFREEIDRRWPWSKRQVDRPSGAGAITAAAQHPFF
eukprot:scaffold54612_cov72-Cyclotella_meneghiniana.AAC.1